MNGIISSAEIRSDLSLKQIASSVGGGLCLFVGFVLGMNAPPISLHVPSLFQPKIISVSKFSWLPETLHSPLHLAQKEVSDLSVQVEFKPYQLPKELPAKLPNSFAHHEKRLVYRDLALAFENLWRLRDVTLQQPQNVYQDYILASARMQQEFEVVSDPELTHQIVAKEEEIRSEQKLNWIASSADRQSSNTPEKNGSTPSSIPRKNSLHALNAPQKNENSGNLKLSTQQRTPPVMAKVELENLSIQDRSNFPETFPVPQAIVPRMVPFQPHHSVEPPIARNYAQEIQLPQSPEPIQVLQKDVLKISASSAEKVSSGAALFSPMGVKNEEKKSSVAIHSAIANNTISGSMPLPTTPLPVPVNPSKSSWVAPSPSSQCKELSNQVFLKGSSQICPEQHFWVTRNWDQSGWVKVEGSQNLPTLSLNPAPNQGATLLLDQNALALIAIKAGVHLASGTGFVLGKLPAGYKVEFSGRSEDAEYFQANGVDYFAILNAEPGANVVQLISERDQDISGSVFSPVIENTVTYLDLVAPRKVTLPVHIIKNGGSKDLEVSGLTVGLSTQNGIQAITQRDGTAHLKNIYLVPGFPIFVDVSSKAKNSASYTYRYELNQKDSQDRYLLAQAKETSLARWLKQVKQGLSDQSAMVLGFVNRKHLDGFKSNYYLKTELLSSHFGLEPKDYSILWNDVISEADPLEGDQPRFMSVQVPEGLSKVEILNESKQMIQSQFIPVSPRVINVISE